jgi:hypothetical protein
MVPGRTYASGGESRARSSAESRRYSLEAESFGVEILSLSSPFYFRHRAALGDISIAAIKRLCGYRIGLQHSTFETRDLTTGWEAGKSEFLAYAVVKNVTRLAGRRNEMHPFASLTQNAHADWHV